MKHTITTFLENLPPETLKQCMEAIKDYGSQYMRMINDKPHSKIYAMMDIYETIDEFIKENTDMSGISCKKGCAHCCYLCVYITPDEAITILDYCDKNNIEVDWKQAGKQMDFTSDNWTEQRVYASRCMFLKDGECSIYPVRPMACRKYFVATDPSLCDTTTGRHEVAILSNIDVELLVVAIHGIRTFDTLPKQLLKLK